MSSTISPITMNSFDNISVGEIRHQMSEIRSGLDRIRAVTMEALSSVTDIMSNKELADFIWKEIKSHALNQYNYDHGMTLFDCVERQKMAISKIDEILKDIEFLLAKETLSRAEEEKARALCEMGSTMILLNNASTQFSSSTASAVMEKFQQ